MKMFKKIVIIGTGLIGGSLGLAVKKKYLAKTVVGLSLHLKNAKLAKRIGAIDSVGKSLDSVKGADLVILATPVESIANIAAKIKDKLDKDCIVIDVGSTKEKIVSELDPIIPNFIGCHPLAGSERRGVIHLENDIFSGSICILTPTALTNKKSLDRIKEFWAKLGAKIVLISPKKHDQALAFTSHLPHAIAFTLIRTIPDKFLNLSSKGLKDSSRISGSDPNLWAQIFLSNRNLLPALAVFQKQLSALKSALKNKDKAFLITVLKAANKKREKLG